jgi:hypothetical protein
MLRAISEGMLMVRGEKTIYALGEHKAAKKTNLR